MTSRVAPRRREALHVGRSGERIQRYSRCVTARACSEVSSEVSTEKWLLAMWPRLPPEITSELQSRAGVVWSSPPVADGYHCNGYQPG